MGRVEEGARAVKTEDELLSKLDRWVSQQSQPPTLKDVLATGDVELFGAYILRGFREAASAAVAARERVDAVRAVALDVFGGDVDAAEVFLRSPHPRLDGNAPLAMAADTPEGASNVVAMLREGSGRPSPG
jgi:hypothetical protein